jgi:D-alanyl-D-alanine carboxypeptidase
MFRGPAVVGALGLLAAAACSRASSQPADTDAATPTSAATILADSATPAVSPSPPATTTVAAVDAGSASDPFGIARTSPRIRCGGVAGRHVADKDLLTTFVNGDDLLAIVNRSPTGVLAPDWAPSDLVELQSGTPKSASECDKVQCLRKEAAAGLVELMAEMKKRGFPGKVESAFRSYGSQCGTFLRWAQKGTFCDATEQSALPGHSQHQLGTTVDLFTEDWASSDDPRGVFREGFGCTPAGKFLQEHATEFGFVMPYPIHPDDRHPKQKCVVRWDIPIFINPRTGYRFEHWHFRYVGKDAAKRFEAALAASGPGAPTEITVEQWLRAERGIGGADAELPVCDGCNCGACTTLAAPGENACDKKGGAIHLDEHGKAVPSEGAPSLVYAKQGHVKKWHGPVLDVKVDVPDLVLTQPPVVGPEGAGYAAGSTFMKLAPYPETQPRAYAPLARAWVVAVEPIPNDTGVAWPWRAALAPSTVGQIYDRANVLLPAHPGSINVRVPLPQGVAKAKVVLLEGGVPKTSEQTVDLR